MLDWCCNQSWLGAGISVGLVLESVLAWCWNQSWLGVGISVELVLGAVLAWCWNQCWLGACGPRVAYIAAGCLPEDMRRRCGPVLGWCLVRRRRRLANIGQTLDQRLLCCPAFSCACVVHLNSLHMFCKSVNTTEITTHKHLTETCNSVFSRFIIAAVRV